MINRILEKISGKWIFLILVTVCYVILAILNFDLFKIVITQLYKLILQILPVFILVFFLMFISNLFLDSNKIIKYTGKDSGIKSWLIAILTGILSTGPIYMWYPLLSDMKDKGTKNSFIATFLYNRAIKIALLPIMIYYFGLPFTIILSIYMILFSVLNGIVVDKILNFKKV